MRDSVKPLIQESRNLTKWLKNVWSTLFDLSKLLRCCILNSCVHSIVCSSIYQINKAASVQKLASLDYQWFKFGLICSAEKQLNKYFWIFHACSINMVQLLPESETAYWKIFYVDWWSENFYKQKCESLTVFLFPLNISISVCKICFFFKLLNSLPAEYVSPLVWTNSNENCWDSVADNWWFLDLEGLLFTIRFEEEQILVSLTGTEE